MGAIRDHPLLHVTNDSSLADFSFSHFELGLDQSDHRGPAVEKRLNLRENQAKGNKRNIDRRKVCGTQQIRELQVADVGSFEDENARIVSEFPIELAVTYINSVNPRRAQSAKATPSSARLKS